MGSFIGDGAELLCMEAGEPKQALMDPVFLEDDRVLANYLRLEEYYTIPHKYMDFQLEVKPYMRRIVTQWMLDVCQESRREPNVFTVAVYFMDQFLSTYPNLKKNRLQLMCTACMLLASKLNETWHISTEKLVQYTSNSISHAELLDWELLVASKLKFDLAPVIASDFLELFLPRLNLPTHWQQQVREMSRFSIDLTALELEFVMYPPSMIAAACMSAALETVIPDRMQASLYIAKLPKIANLDMELLKSCQDHIQLVTLKQHEEMGSGGQANKEEPISHPGTPTDTLSVSVQ